MSWAERVVAGVVRGRRHAALTFVPSSLSPPARLMGDLKNADQSFAEYREKFAQMDDENKQLQRLLDDATLKREAAQDRLRGLEVTGCCHRPRARHALTTTLPSAAGPMRARQRQPDQRAVVGRIGVVPQAVQQPRDHPGACPESLVDPHRSQGPRAGLLEEGPTGQRGPELRREQDPGP